MSQDERKDIHNSDIPLVCQACEVRHQGVCGALEAEQLLKLSKHTIRKVIPSGSELHRGGEDSDRCSNIMGGVAKLSKLMSDGRQQIVGLQFAPDMVGRTFASESTVAVEAATDVRLCSFPRSVIEEIMSEAPELEHRLHLQKLKELDEARDWMLTLGRKSAVEKVASFLFLLATHIDPEKASDDKSVTLELPMKRSDIADFLGLTIETISRQLTNLRKRGLIDIQDRRTVIIADIDRLKSAMEQDLSK
ncbi:MAG: helix-turn-helix domain-containing protein [Rhizobiaceae bacterium]|nr:helix-turn-helix domain-containing protein [Rhizobiaceae bacterium]